MNKIICDICGTSYQETYEQCPICGYRQYPQTTVNQPASDPGMEDWMDESVPQKHKEIFDFDEVNPEEEEEEDEVEAYYYEDEPEEENRSNVFLVVLLVIIITLLLTATAFLFFRFYLPNTTAEPPSTEPSYVPQTETTVETTELRIPCQSLALTSGVTELNREGQLWLLHVIVLPEDTTDELIFYSEDESVVTVTKDGRLTAIAEGETYVHIICGEKEIKCRVVVAFTQPETTEETQTDMVPESVEVDEVPESSQTEAETESTQATESTGEIVLKLKQSDVSSNKRGVSFDLILDCDLKPEDVTWLTLDSNVAIVRNGTVTTIGPGSTKIVAQYKGQQAVCIVRCDFR